MNSHWLLCLIGYSWLLSTHDTMKVKKWQSSNPRAIALRPQSGGGTSTIVAMSPLTTRRCIACYVVPWVTWCTLTRRELFSTHLSCSVAPTLTAVLLDAPLRLSWSSFILPGLSFMTAKTTPISKEKRYCLMNASLSFSALLAGFRFTSSSSNQDRWRGHL